MRFSVLALDYDGTIASDGVLDSGVRAAIANLALILANRSWSRIIVATLRSPNPALWWIVAGSLGVLGLVLYVPFIRELFRFSMLHVNDLLICLGAGVVSVLWFEALKIITRGRLIRA
jgi:Ca2+-transporting ATPase